jgi:hypothetical protein
MLNKKMYVFISGLVMVMVGGYIALTPNSYLIAMEMHPVENTTELYQSIMPSQSLLSDLRGMGGLILIMGVFVFISTFKNTWINSAMLMSVLVYVTFVGFRTLGFIVDGLPQMEIIIAYFIEFVLAFFGIALLPKSVDIQNNREV